jgi:hypothetical protein
MGRITYFELFVDIRQRNTDSACFIKYIIEMANKVLASWYINNQINLKQSYLQNCANLHICRLIRVSALADFWKPVFESNCY